MVLETSHYIGLPQIWSNLDVIVIVIVIGSGYLLTASSRKLKTMAEQSGFDFFTDKKSRKF